LSLCLLGFAPAQESLPWGAPDRLTVPDAESEQRLAAAYRERQFVERANRFAKRWTQFALEYNQHRAVDVKAARAVSKAFQELERGEGWPKQ